MVKGPPRRPGELAVVCDTMLQGLGRYLRCCGVDTVMLQNGEEHMKAVEVRGVDSITCRSFAFCPN